MTVSFTRLDPVGEDHDALVEFMTRNEFPFHGRPHPRAADVETAIRDGAYRDEDNDSFWIDHRELGRIGFLRLEDLSDDAPLFDLRLDAPFRGRGLGADVLKAATDHVFRTLADVQRFEGQTREDNLAMRRTFVRCGWLKEAHYREAWPVDGGAPLASVAYGILRRDWETGRTTPLLWDDLPA
ncbi:GNAT family N-acetyltransferase [Brachybacterium avium]|uniref:GNAT family N-acetyltransferase n=1 Tax=Brachybacterium avium TaxID=2017485 RepID=A0A220UD12_9MICO|nr:GNAT family protein [Brachybacterium avium]ASK65985.1 GNAT family N-acetyltransferase [Brachybacterium avium]